MPLFVSLMFVLLLFCLCFVMLMPAAPRQPQPCGPEPQGAQQAYWAAAPPHPRAGATATMGRAKGVSWSRHKSVRRRRDDDRSVGTRIILSESAFLVSGSWQRFIATDSSNGVERKMLMLLFVFCVFLFVFLLCIIIVCVWWWGVGLPTRAHTGALAQPIAAVGWYYQAFAARRS